MCAGLSDSDLGLQRVWLGDVLQPSIVPADRCLIHPSFWTKYSSGGRTGFPPKVLKSISSNSLCAHRTKDTFACAFVAFVAFAAS